jgi:hypothetical protein
MDGTIKLGLMTATTILGLWAAAWIVAEVIIYLSKEDK